jgi:hypothetical protein
MVHRNLVSWLMWLFAKRVPRPVQSRRAALLCLWVAVFAPGWGQEPPPPPEPNYAFFSGIVEEFSDSRITVSRVLPGKPTETRSFVINSGTKVEGRIQDKARVTVGFETRDDGDVAVRIIVRPQKARSSV